MSAVPAPTTTIEGVLFHPKGDCAICHVEKFSTEIQDLIRRNLQTICHGSLVSDRGSRPLYSYQTTLKSFIERYSDKAEPTKLGMIGEFLAHVLITTLFPHFTVVSAFFNLEEKSIKKGFDLLLYRSSDKTTWITEVKSGNLHKGKNRDQTTRDLLNTAKADLLGRLNEQETMYWYNAVTNVRNSLSNKKDYKDALLDILEGYGDGAAENKAASHDKSVVLVSNLFEPLDEKISIATAEAFLETVSKKKPFAKVIVFCMQKATYKRVVDFLQSEAIGAAP